MNMLQPGPGSAWWLFAAADLILFLHIAGGSVGIVSGTVALFAPKGGWLHRRAGTVFFVAMLFMAGIGAAASPLLPVPNYANMVAGIMTLYLLLTSWMTVRRKEGSIGRFEIIGFVAALGVAMAGGVFIVLARNDPSGTIEGTPPQAFYIFALLGTIGAAGDLHMIRRGGLFGAPRIARHLWRMCAALLIASGSFFLGQQRIMPVAIQGSRWLFVPVIVPFAVMLFWLVRVRIGSSFRKAAVAA